MCHWHICWKLKPWADHVTNKHYSIVDQQISTLEGDRTHHKNYGSLLFMPSFPKLPYVHTHTFLPTPKSLLMELLAPQVSGYSLNELSTFKKAPLSHPQCNSSGLIQHLGYTAGDQGIGRRLCFLYFPFPPCVNPLIGFLPFKWKCHSFSCVWLLVASWIVVHQAPLSMEFSMQEWVAIPFSRGSSWSRDQTPDPPHCGQILYHLSHQESPSCFLNNNLIIDPGQFHYHKPRASGFWSSK